ncbi:MAG: GDP-mannose 4,6-dehydratase [Candidatus Heimdallarchaeum endolithica]|uniref:GDP-mannose 4,6-dehydratase n=1 Tax=Candidatus Heimdallarchaeum endolithica TaxID=2876572 RepID=A0A9Y1FQB4_9ARCH|nr:MAG: GDP-mannose 4,6-dehydratase [Candidatus Heimdallarchaeum endolithica]
MEETDFENKNILIIGADGFIGSHLFLRLKSLSKNIVRTVYTSGSEKNQVYKVDIRDKEKVKDIFKKKNFNTIYYLAGLINVYESLKNPELYYQVNTFGTLNIMENIRKYQENSKIIFASSALVYGKPMYLPIDETHPLNPITPYSSSKSSAEQIIHGYSKTYGIRAVILRIFNVYGPKQNYNLFIPAFIRRCLESKQILIGNINVTRDYIFINDLVEAMLKVALYSNNEIEYFNIGSGKEIQLETIVNYILQLSKRDKSFLHKSQDLVRENKNEISRIYADITKAKNKLNWTPKTSLKEGLNITYKYYKQNKIS